ncbi:MAG: chloride channel protein [Candidatus Pristimantibacillus sp.]
MTAHSVKPPLFAYLRRWILLAATVGILTGSISALFLASLHEVTNLRVSHAWLLWLLPFGGALVSFIYMKYGQDSAKGNNLLLERIYIANGSVPLRMVPLVLFGTLITHLFGGSAGREGTAVQMGGGLADFIGRRFHLGGAERQIILMCGISSGFGAIFGTPIAGTVFGLEVVALRVIPYRAILPCLIASFTGHYVTIAWGIHHSSYSLGALPIFSSLLLLKIIIASILFGLTAWLFSTLTHRLKAIFTKLIPNPVIKSFAGGVLIIAMVYLLGTRDYLGLGLPLMDLAFEESVRPFTFLLKLLFTVITLGSGFQGGEVTPLFVIGSTLGSSLASLLSVSIPLLAGIGFVAVFGGATNTPVASFIMGLELFGFNGYGMLYLLIGCTIGYLCSGRIGIYSSQRTRNWLRRTPSK